MRGIARILFWLLFLVILVATLGPLGLRPESGLPPQVERCGAFLLASFLLMLAHPRHRYAWLVGLALAAGLLEALQTLIPGRDGRLVDFEAKAAGVAAGAIIGWAIEWLWFGRAGALR